MPEYVVSSQAYVKAVLHCAKYPWAAVHGVFLGEKKNGKVRMVDAIPLSHNWIQLTPMFDVAVQQVQLYLKSQKKNELFIAGYYAAYEDTTTTQLSPASGLLAKMLIDLDKDAAAFVIDAKKLGPGADELALVPYLYVESQWKEQSKPLVAIENNRVLDTTKKLIAERAEVAIHDFDEHMEDVSLDWLQNRVLSERIKAA